MVRRSVIALITMVASMTATPAVSQENLATQPDPVKVASTIETQWVTNYNAGNLAGIGHMFAADGTYTPPAGPVLPGASAIEKFLDGGIKAGYTNCSIKVLEAHAAGNAVWVLGEYSVFGSGQNSSKHISGHFMKVLTPDGTEWRIRTLIANLTPPPAPPSSTR